VGFFLIIFIVLLALKPEANSASFVFTEFRNSTGWSSDGVAWCLGMLTSCYVLTGRQYDTLTKDLTTNSCCCRLRFRDSHVRGNP
jgi:hypothetical protein